MLQRSWEDCDDPALTKELCYGVMRHLPSLEFIANRFIKKSFKDKDKDLHVLILLGIYQLFHMRIPPHAAISETVEAAKVFKKNWAAGLINGILRNCQRQKEKLQSKLNGAAETHYNHPQWFIDKLKLSWPEHWQDILKQNNQRGPMTLRVNLAKKSRAEYLSLLNDAGILAKEIAACDGALILDVPCGVEKLPGFDQGWVSVQDASAQLAADFLSIENGQRVLDACAAPGGKTCHLLEKASLDVLAIDNDAERLERVTDNLKRLQLKAKILVADASDPSNWWDGHTFDRILLDVPCSATGVIRRNPDIKYHRREEDIQHLSELQFTILKNSWSLLSDEGLMLYVTCSVLPDENESVIERFIDQQPSARVVPITCNIAQPLRHGIQVLPQEDFDGFYFCLLKCSL